MKYTRKQLVEEISDIIMKHVHNYGDWVDHDSAANEIIDLLEKEDNKKMRKCVLCKKDLSYIPYTTDGFVGDLICTVCWKEDTEK